ncbi:hypothetical protein PVAP13_9KG249400 [Panicum virgatum]|uniref:Uncharacterized protein n=1 Tax=Panicum virgatum TaxID=38727 RepID=A0A8T0NL33_PANVG|nr:hypothetical protein PVAP13_9KG249400 [Panicum virgatum]
MASRGTGRRSGAARRGRQIRRGRAWSGGCGREHRAVACGCVCEGRRRARAWAAMAVVRRRAGRASAPPRSFGVALAAAQAVAWPVCPARGAAAAVVGCCSAAGILHHIFYFLNWFVEAGDSTCPKNSFLGPSPPSKIHF